MRQIYHISYLLYWCYWIIKVNETHNVLITPLAYNQSTLINDLHNTMRQSVGSQCFKFHQLCRFSRTRIEILIMKIQCSWQSKLLLKHLDISFHQWKMDLSIIKLCGCFGRRENFTLSSYAEGCTNNDYLAFSATTWYIAVRISHCIFVGV